MNTENRWLVNLVRATKTLSWWLARSGTRLPQLMNTSDFHENVGSVAIIFLVISKLLACVIQIFATKKSKQNPSNNSTRYNILKCVHFIAFTHVFKVFGLNL